MKRKLIVAVCALFAFTAANAIVTVKQGNQSVRYPSKSVVTIKGTADTVVDYDGTEIFVPKGTVAVLSPAWNGSVMFTSNSLKGVKVAGLTLDASAPSCVIVNQDSENVTARIGSVRVTDKNGKSVVVNRGQMISSDKMDQVASAPEVQTSQLAYIGNVLKGEVIAAPELDALKHPVQNKTLDKKPAPKVPAADNLPVAEEDGLAGVSELVNHNFADVNAEQALRDVAEETAASAAAEEADEEETLSPSAPTAI